MVSGIKHDQIDGRSPGLLVSTSDALTNADGTNRRERLIGEGRVVWEATIASRVMA